jgi:hypothetical protein
MPDTTCLYTTVKNPLAFSRTYGYLGAHGKLLPAGAHFTQIGDLVDTLMGSKRYKKRQTAALERDLLNSKIEIITTPRPILKDATTSAIKALDLDAAAIGVIDPCWGAYTDV